MNRISITAIAVLSLTCFVFSGCRNERPIIAASQSGIQVTHKHPMAVTVRMLLEGGGQSQSQQAVEQTLITNEIFTQVTPGAPISLLITLSAMTYPSGAWTKHRELPAKWTVTGPNGFTDHIQLVGMGNGSSGFLASARERGATKDAVEDMIRQGANWVSKLNLPGDQPESVAAPSTTAPSPAPAQPTPAKF